MEAIPGDVLHNIFEMSGSRFATRASVACKAWRLRPSSTLYPHFIRMEFGLDVATLPGLDPRQCEFEALFRYFVDAAKKSQGSIGIFATVEFADDAGHYPGFPPENALRADDEAYCTLNTDKNVDIIIKLRQPSIITSLGASNVGYGYSNLLKEAVAFGLIRDPVQHLGDTRDYDSCSPPDFLQSSHKLPPLAAISFPNFPACRNQTSKQDDLSYVSCFAHFKLLSSFNPRNQEVNNIDLGRVHIEGIELPDLFSHLATAFRKPVEVIMAALDHNNKYTRQRPVKDNGGQWANLLELE